MLSQYSSPCVALDNPNVPLQSLLVCDGDSSTSRSTKRRPRPAAHRPKKMLAASCQEDADRRNSSEQTLSMCGRSASMDGFAYRCPVIESGVWFNRRPTISSSTPASIATVANVRRCACLLHSIRSGDVRCPSGPLGDGNTHCRLRPRTGARISWCT